MLQSEGVYSAGYDTWLRLMDRAAFLQHGPVSYFQPDLIWQVVQV